MGQPSLQAIHLRYFQDLNGPPPESNRSRLSETHSDAHKKLKARSVYLFLVMEDQFTLHTTPLFYPLMQKETQPRQKLFRVATRFPLRGHSYRCSACSGFRPRAAPAPTSLSLPVPASGRREDTGADTRRRRGKRARPREHPRSFPVTSNDPARSFTVIRLAYPSISPTNNGFT